MFILGGKKKPLKQPKKEQKDVDEVSLWLATMQRSSLNLMNLLEHISSFHVCGMFMTKLFGCNLTFNISDLTRHARHLLIL